jgi:hypothetical protein
MRDPVSQPSYRTLIVSLTPRQYHFCYSCLAVFRLKIPLSLVNFVPKTLISSVDERSSQGRVLTKEMQSPQILNRLRDMHRLDLLTAGQVRKSAGQLDHAVIGPRAQVQRWPP